MKVDIVFYSWYGHVYEMAEAIAAGVRAVEGAEVRLMQVPETVPDDVLESAGAKAAKEAFAHIPEAAPDQLAEGDATIFGTPTRFGSAAGPMRNFIDQLGGLWQTGALVGKVGSAFTSTATQHGGQETTLFSVHTSLFHLGYVIVGLPYSAQGQMTIEEISGGSPYGVTTIAGGDGSRQPSENELSLARFQGKYVAEITKALLAGRA